MERIELAMNLIDERERLGYSRKNFATQVNMSTENLRLYETGKTNMSADFLAAAAQLGVDVQFILTGIRSENLHLVSQKFDKLIDQQIDADNNNVQFNGDVSGSSVVGNQNNITQVQGNLHQGDVNHITTEQHVTKTIADVRPGELHITEAQAAKLQDLVRQIAEKEEQVRRNPKSFKAIWASLNSHCKVSRYRLIALTDFDKAERYLRKWIGRLNSTATAQKANPTTERTRKISYIKTNAKQFNLDTWVKDYIKKNFNVSSLTELDDIELTKTYRAVSNKKSSLKKAS